MNLKIDKTLRRAFFLIALSTLSVLAVITLFIFSINTVAFQQGRLTREAYLPALMDLLLAILFAEYLWRTSGQ